MYNNQDVPTTKRVRYFDKKSQSWKDSTPDIFKQCTQIVNNMLTYQTKVNTAGMVFRAMIHFI